MSINKRFAEARAKLAMEAGRKFDIEWSDPEAFIQRLWTEWNSYRQG